MKLSTRAKYGLKALIDLGLYSEKEAVSLQSIAGRQNISVSYLEQALWISSGILSIPFELLLFIILSISVFSKVVRICL